MGLSEGSFLARMSSLKLESCFRFSGRRFFARCTCVL
jgi:hypothetical protein